jgi:hypothetical protein
MKQSPFLYTDSGSGSQEILFLMETEDPAFALSLQPDKFSL